MTLLLGYILEVQELDRNYQELRKTPTNALLTSVPDHELTVLAVYV
jgi:hypothetical protein